MGQRFQPLDHAPTATSASGPASRPPSLIAWHGLSGDDAFTIDRPWQTIGGSGRTDDFLGYQSVGASDGRDDNLHLRSPYGEASQGGLAAVEDVGGTGLPVMLR